MLRLNAKEARRITNKYAAMAFGWSNIDDLLSKVENQAVYGLNYITIPYEIREKEANLLRQEEYVVVVDKERNLTHITW